MPEVKEALDKGIKGWPKGYGNETLVCKLADAVNHIYKSDIILRGFGKSGILEYI